MKKAFLAMLVVTAALASCKKDDDSGPSRNELLTSGKWQLTAARASGNIATVTIDSNIYDKGLKACDRDDLYQFNSDGTETKDEGTDKCSSTTPQTSQVGTWALLSNDTKLYGTLLGTSDTASIVDLTSTTMNLSKIETGNLGGFTYSFKVDMTFVKK